MLAKQQNILKDLRRTGSDIEENVSSSLSDFLKNNKRSINAIKRTLLPASILAVPSRLVGSSLDSFMDHIDASDAARSRMFALDTFSGDNLKFHTKYNFLNNIKENLDKFKSGGKLPRPETPYFLQSILDDLDFYPKEKATKLKDAVEDLYRIYEGKIKQIRAGDVFKKLRDTGSDSDLYHHAWDNMDDDIFVAARKKVMDLIDDVKVTNKKIPTSWLKYIKQKPSRLLKSFGKFNKFNLANVATALPFISIPLSLAMTSLLGRHKGY